MVREITHPVARYCDRPGTRPRSEGQEQDWPGASGMPMTQAPSGVAQTSAVSEAEAEAPVARVPRQAPAS